jgi:hypothetical protein
MRKLLVVVIALVLSAAPALAQDKAAPDLEKGYNLGEMATLANLVALELSTIQDLAAPLGSITDDKYNSGEISDDDVFEAQLVLAYVMWRCQFMLQPVCGAGIDKDAFTDPGLPEFKAEGQAVLGDVMSLVDAFLAADDSAAFAAAGAFANGITEHDLINRLYKLSDEALAAAGKAEKPAPAAEPKK